MQNVSPLYKEKVIADSRYFRAKVLMYIEGDSAPPLELLDDDITDISILEEAKAEARDPIGSVTSNECSLTLRNDDYRFTPSNVNSPLYGKLVPNIKFEVFIELCTDMVNEVFESVCVGTFMTGDWDAPASGLDVMVVGTDIISELSAKPIADQPLMLDTTIGGMFETIFTGLGLTPEQYEVDPTLTQPVPVGWLPEGAFNEVMQSLCVAGNCSVAADRYNRIIAKSNISSTEPVTSFTDEDLILDASNPQRIIGLYTGVKVNYYIPQLVTDASLYSVSDVVVGPGETVTLDDIAFSDVPVASVKRIVTSNIKNVEVIIDSICASSLSMRLVNKGTEQAKIGLEIIGDRYQLNKLSHTKYNEEAKASWGDRVYEVDNSYIQSHAVAVQYAESLVDLVSDPFAEYTLSTRGNPAIETFDTITILAPSCYITQANVTVIRSTIDYDGALTIGMICRKPITMGGVG